MQIVFKFKIAAIVTAVALLCGCTPAQQPAPATPSPIIEDFPVSDKPVPGGTLMIPMPLNPSTLDPLMADTKEMQAVLSLVYENLIEYDANNHLVPSLAENWEMDDEEGLRWRITIRKGAKWHGSQSEATAHDAVFTLDLLRQEAYADSIYASGMPLIESYEAADDRTLIITAKSPGMLVLNALNFPLVSKAYYSAGQFIGTGPYKVQSYAEQSDMMLTVNEGWWRNLPYIEKILAIRTQDNDTALASLSINRLNYVPTMSLSANKFVEQDQITANSVMTQQYEMMLIRSGQKELSDIRVRQAIILSLDRREIINRVYLNHAFSTDVPFPPDNFLYVAETKIYDYDREKAAALLKDAGWQDVDGNGVLDKVTGGEVTELALTLLVNDTVENQIRKEAANVIAEQLAKAGIKVTVTTAPWTAGSGTQAKEYLNLLKSGSFDMALIGVNISRDGDLAFLLGTDGALNYGGYSSSEMDEALKRYAQATTEAAQRESAKSVQMQFINDLPVIPLYFRTASIVYDQHILGVVDVRDMQYFKTVEKWYLAGG